MVNESPSLFIYFASVMAVIFGIIVLVSKNPISSAVALMGTLFSTAGIYFALGNFFLGAVQILVYAGAIAVLFVFIVMLLDLRPTLLRFVPGRKPYLVVAGIVTAVLAVLFFSSIRQSPTLPQEIPFQTDARQTAEYFISQYHVAFQAAGFLVFGAILGAIVMARGHLGRRDDV